MPGRSTSASRRRGRNDKDRQRVTRSYVIFGIVFIGGCCYALVHLRGWRAAMPPSVENGEPPFVDALLDLARAQNATLGRLRKQLAVYHAMVHATQIQDANLPRRLEDDSQTQQIHEDQRPAKAKTAIIPRSNAAAEAFVLKGKPLLTLGIPTVPRPKDLDYLGRTLEAILRQLPESPADPFYGQVLIIVMNMHGDGHSAFEQQRRRYASGHPKAMYVEFLEKTTNYPDVQGAKVAGAGTKNKPGVKVRQQTRDIVSLLRAAAGRSALYLFMEDDMELCAHGLMALHYAIAKSWRYHGEFSALRVSYGMNGIVMPDGDVLPFAQYLLDHQARRPPDHLVVEWFAGETPETELRKADRVNTAFRFNLFNHLGSISTLRSGVSKRFPMCFEPLGVPVLFAVESFDPKACPDDDIWPCNTPNRDRGPRLPWDGLWTEKKIK